jgi:EF hand
MALTQLQERKLTNFFRICDTDKDGLVRRDDHLAIVERACTVRGYKCGTDAYVTFHTKLWRIWERLARFADTDDDQAVTLEEWLRYFDGVINGAPEVTAVIAAGVGYMLEMVDLDGDERLNPSEYRALLWVYRIDQQLAEQNFRRLDLNGDGFITKTELLQLFQEWFLGSDPNAPGNHLWGPI